MLTHQHRSAPPEGGEGGKRLGLAVLVMRPVWGRGGDHDRWLQSCVQSKPLPGVDVHSRAVRVLVIHAECRQPHGKDALLQFLALVLPTQLEAQARLRCRGGKAAYNPQRRARSDVWAPDEILHPRALLCQVKMNLSQHAQAGLGCKGEKGCVHLDCEHLCGERVAEGEELVAQAELGLEHCAALVQTLTTLVH